MSECRPLFDGGGGGGGAGGGGSGGEGGGGGEPGRAVQVDLIKPTLKAPATQRLQLKYVGLLSNIAFKFNLRRYSLVAAAEGRAAEAVGTHG